MLASEIIADVQKIFGDEAGIQIDSTDLIRWINDGQLDIVNKTACLIKDASPAITIVAGTYRYALPADFLKFKRVSMDGRTIELAPASILDQLNQTRHSTSGYTSGTPKFYYREGGYICFYPTPDAVVPCVLTYVYRPATVTAGTDQLSIREEYSKYLKRFCLARAYELDDNFEQAASSSKEFSKSTDELKSDENNPSTESYASIRPVGDDAW